MKAVFIPALLLFTGLSFAAADPESQSLVGVLMDADCAATAGTGRHTEAPVAPAGTDVTAKRRTLREGTRSRTVAARRAEEPDRYDACKATALTSAFAIHTDGQLFVLDNEGNEVIRQQMRNDSFRAAMLDESGAPRWLTVMVDGKKSGDHLTVTSVRR